jgi:hypothetical protein
MSYIIRSFDPIGAHMQVEYDTGALVHVFLPIDSDRRVPEGEQLDQIIIHSEPQPVTPPEPVTNADVIEALVVPFPPLPTTWDKIRRQRNRLLFDSDWTQLTDVNLTVDEKTAWQTYRIQLRDITTTFADPDSVVWPVPPEVT